MCEAEKLAANQHETNVTAAAQFVRETLITRYAVPSQQILVLDDPTLPMIDQEWRPFLSHISNDSQLIVYYVGRAMWDADGTCVLATKESRGQPTPTGLELQSVITLVESCQAREKVVIVDAPPSTQRPGAPQGQSAANSYQSLGLTMRTTAVVFNCSENKPLQPPEANDPGQFAACLSNGYSGEADANHDGRIEVGEEIFAFLNSSLSGINPADSPAGKTPRAHRSTTATNK